MVNFIIQVNEGGAGGKSVDVYRRINAVHDQFVRSQREELLSGGTYTSKLMATYILEKVSRNRRRDASFHVARAREE